MKYLMDWILVYTKNTFIATTITKDFSDNFPIVNFTCNFPIPIPLHISEIIRTKVCPKDDQPGRSVIPKFWSSQ